MEIVVYSFQLCSIVDLILMLRGSWSEGSVATLVPGWWLVGICDLGFCSWSSMTLKLVAFEDLWISFVLAIEFQLQFLPLDISD